MRVEYNELMEKLGVGHILSPYETRPWFHYEEEEGISCSAEVRVGPGADDVELEIQYIHDELDTRYEDESDFGAPQQIMFMRFMPNKERIWQATAMRIKDENYVNKIHSWGERGTDFFCLFIGALQMGELPNIDEMIDEHLTDHGGGRGGRRRGRVGKKGFKVDQKPVGMGMKN